MGHDDIRKPVQPRDGGSQGSSGSTQLVTSRPTPQMNAQAYGHSSTIVLTGTGQEVSHRNFQQQSVGAGANQNKVVRNALSSDKRWMEHSENYLPISNGDDNLTIPEDEMGFVQAVSVSLSTHSTLPVNVMGQRNPTMTPMTVLESPMITTPSFQSVPLMSNGGAVQYQQQGGFQSEQNSLQLQHQDSSYQLSEPASLEDLMMDFVDSDMPVNTPQFNHCPTGAGNGNNNGGSHAESGNSGQSHCVTGYSHQNYGPSMITGGNGGGLGGTGDNDPYWNNHAPLRNHYVDDNVFANPDPDDILRYIEENQYEDMSGPSVPFKPDVQRSEIFPEIDNLSGNTVTTPSGDNMMAYYSKFDSSGGGLQPMEESSNPSPATPPISTPPTAAAGGVSPAVSTPAQVQMPLPAASTPVLTAVAATSTPVTATAGADSIGSAFDMIKIMKKPCKLPRPPVSRPSNLTLEPPVSPAYSYASSAPSPLPVPPTPSTPHLSHPVQVSTPGTPTPPPKRAPSLAPEMPPPSPAAPPTPANVRPFDCSRYEENGKMFLELLVRNDLPEAERRFTLQAFFHSAQFCMDLTEIMRNPADLKISNHVCANICDFKFDSEQSKLVFSIPSNCKHVNQWVSEKGLKASFLDRHAVLQQVLNTMAAIHNGGSDKSLWGSFMVFVAPDLRVYMIPDIIPMLVKMQGAVGDGSFHPRYEDSRAISELFKLLIPPTINQNQSWISPGVNQLLQSFVQLVQHPSSVFKMAEIARTLGEKRMCRMEVDYLGLEMLDIFCVEHELVLRALTSIQDMVPERSAIVWTSSHQPVAIQDLATAVRQMRLRVSYN